MARRLACSNCGRAVTDEETAIEMLGLHEHQCVNPHGYRFRVGCFAHADGVEITSNGSGEWSWFPGYRWRLCDCAGCGEHLGWLFTRVDGRFYGLILDRLRAGDEMR